MKVQCAQLVHFFLYSLPVCVCVCVYDDDDDNQLAWGKSYATQYQHVCVFVCVCFSIGSVCFTHFYRAHKVLRNNGRLGFLGGTQRHKLQFGQPDGVMSNRRLVQLDGILSLCTTLYS